MRLYRGAVLVQRLPCLFTVFVEANVCDLRFYGACSPEAPATSQDEHLSDVLQIGFYMVCFRLGER